MCPANLASTLAYLDARPDIDIVMSTYEVMTRMPGSSPTVEQTTMYTRLWRRSAGLLFREVCHENVDHARNPDGSNWLMVPSGLVVRDWRDSVGMGVRPKHRNFKVLLLEYERLAEIARLGADTRPSKHLLMYLADEAVPVVPRFALEVLDEVEYPTPADEIWRHIIRGQAMVRLGELRFCCRRVQVRRLSGQPARGPAPRDAQVRPALCRMEGHAVECDPPVPAEDVALRRLQLRAGDGQAAPRDRQGHEGSLMAWAGASLRWKCPVCRRKGWVDFLYDVPEWSRIYT